VKSARGIVDSDDQLKSINAASICPQRQDETGQPGQDRHRPAER